MTERDVQQKLTEWAGDRDEPAANFVNRLALALGSPPQRKLWAFVDIRREFEAMVRDPEDLASDDKLFRIRSFAQKALPVIYVLPILFTWLELGLAVTSYRAEARDNPGEQIDFLAVWSGAQGDHIGIGFQAVAWGIVAAVAAIIGAHVANAVTTNRIARQGLARYDQVSDLLLDAQLSLVSSRAVTPEEMADSLTTAAGVLQDALAEVAGVLPRFETISTRLGDAVNGLATASTNLDSTSRLIGAAADSLNDLPSRAAPLIQALGETPGALQRMLQIFGQTSDEANKVNRAIVNAGSQLTNEAAEVANAIAAIGRQLSDLVRQVQDATTLVSHIPDAMAEPAKVARDLAIGLESATPVALVFRDSSEQIRESITALGAMVKELRYSADQYRAVNDQHRRQN
jgi:methyl-accepting chemotaxis protein